MNREEIIKLAREAGFESNSLGVTYTSGWLPDLLERFAALVAAAERDRMISEGWRQCAQGQKTSQFCAVAEAIRQEEREKCAKLLEDFARFGDTRDCIAAIRARGEK
jgi:hypothetical protein